MIVEGKISIDLCADGTVHVVSNRSSSVATLLVGRNVDEALGLIPIVFSLCAHAHLTAARMATGRPVSQADALVVLAENAREHLLRIMLGWKTGNDVLMPATDVMSLVPEMQKAVTDQTHAVVATGLSDYLKNHVLGMEPRQFLAMNSVCELSDWMAKSDTPASVYLHSVTAKNWQGLGAIETSFLPELSPEPLVQRMQSNQFCLQPDWHGVTRETGPFARHSAVPLVAAVIEAHGAGLLARLVARLVELAQIPGQMCAGLAIPAPQVGLGVVETARGRLIHAAKVQDGVIEAFSILAPTEWNFHPYGVASRALCGLDPEQARAVVEAIDPCVDFELRVA